MRRRPAAGSVTAGRARVAIIYLVNTEPSRLTSVEYIHLHPDREGFRPISMLSCMEGSRQKLLADMQNASLVTTYYANRCQPPANRSMRPGSLFSLQAILVTVQMEVDSSLSQKAGSLHRPSNHLPYSYIFHLQRIHRATHTRPVTLVDQLTL